MFLQCLELAERRRNAFANLEQRQQYVADLRAHRKAHRLARNGFERRKMLVSRSCAVCSSTAKSWVCVTQAMTEPEKYHSIIVDLTRSAWLPHSHPLPKVSVDESLHTLTGRCSHCRRRSGWRRILAEPSAGTATEKCCFPGCLGERLHRWCILAASLFTLCLSIAARSGRRARM